MNRFRNVTLGVAAATLLASGTALYAQGPGFGGPGRGRGGPGGRAGIELPLRQLNLSEEQRQKVQAIRAQARDESKAIVERLRTAHEAQRKAVETVPTNESLIRAAAQELGEAQADAAVQAAKVYSAVWAVLTPAQQAQATTLRAERQARAEARRDAVRERLQQRQQQ